MRLRILTTLTLLSVLLAATAAAASGEPIILKGEIVDLQCYLVHSDSGSGEKHVKCAEMCMRNGLPVGLAAENGELYLLLGSGHDAANDAVIKYAGKVVTVTGTESVRGGLKAIQIQSVKE